MYIVEGNEPSFLYMNEIFFAHFLTAHKERVGVEAKNHFFQYSSESTTMLCARFSICLSLTMLLLLFDSTFIEIPVQFRVVIDPDAHATLRHHPRVEQYHLQEKSYQPYTEAESGS